MVIKYSKLGLVIVCLLMAPKLWAAKGGGWSIGANLGLVTASQDDINGLISKANTAEGGITTSGFGTAYEVTGFLNYRFNGSIIALSFRPSYYTASTTGTNGSSQPFNYSLTGITFFPIFRLYLLESNYIKFFTNAGVGIGSMSGEITEAAANVKFSGSNTGFQGGLGVEFCFSPRHCINLEANYRVLDFPRNLASSASGTFTSTNGRVTQAEAGKELEVNDVDLMTSLTGITGNIGYIFYF